MTTYHSKISDNKEITVAIYPEGHALVFDQAIDPKTGKGWQKRRNLAPHTSKAKAMVDWLKRK